jgi:prephenate dehydrogenase
VILAAPVRQNLALLAELDEHVRVPAVVTDTSSTKRAIVEAARGLPPRFTFVGGHPLGGAAASGLEHARPDLFQARPWLLTPTRADDGRTGVARRVRRSSIASESEGGRLQPSVSDAAGDRQPNDPLGQLSAFVRALGSEPHVLSADAHDRMLAFLSHLPQLTASALMHVVGEEVGEDGLALAGRGLADTTRLASSPADIWQDITATNADQIGPALDTLIAVLQSLRRDLGEGERLSDVFTDAARWRDLLKK